MRDVVKDDKIIVQFRHVGDAPVLKQARFKVPASAQFRVITEMLRSQLNLPPATPLVTEHSIMCMLTISDF